ncbi:Hypothetical predicted protein [Scomber scombrus]|uniref:Uncharacterized protein n=1 Tax=Scomber scombrus TaxID=13677 RepID=A0AAV1P0V7_SCOSC
MLNHSKSNQRPEVLDQERFWIPKITRDYNWDWKVFQLGKLLALDITNRQRCQTHYRGSISLLHLINELHRTRITDSDSRLHSFSASFTSHPSEQMAAQTPFVSDAKVLELGKPSRHCKSSQGLSVSQSIRNYWTTSSWITVAVDLSL